MRIFITNRNGNIFRCFLKEIIYTRTEIRPELTNLLIDNERVTNIYTENMKRIVEI